MSTPSLTQDAATSGQARLPAALAANSASRSTFKPSGLHVADPLAGRALISTREAVSVGLGSRSKVQDLIRQNKVETIKVGRSRLIVVESVRALISNGGV